MNHLCITDSGSAMDSVSAALLRGEGVLLMLANLAGVSYESAPTRFREIRSTILDEEDFPTLLLRCAVQYSTEATRGGRPTPDESRWGIEKLCGTNVEIKMEMLSRQSRHYLLTE
jgi:hypothetical protein